MSRPIKTPAVESKSGHWIMRTDGNGSNDCPNREVAECASNRVRVSRKSAMWCHILFLISACFFLALPIAASGIASDIRIVTEEFPPYDFASESGRVEGMATDVVREVLAIVDMDVEIEIFPWARAFKLASENPNTMLYSVVRTEERESQFQWIGIVCEVNSYLFKLRTREDITAEKLMDLKDYTIGVIRGWAGQEYLRQNGFVHLEDVAMSENNIRKLLSGRVDLIEDYEANLIFRMKKMGLDPNLVDRVYFNADISGPLYAVFSKDTAGDIVDSFKDAFSQVHLDGGYDAIQSEWRDMD